MKVPNFKKIYIGSKIKSFDLESSIYDMPKLKVIIDKKNPYIKMKNGAVYSKNGKKMYCLINSKKKYKIATPEPLLCFLYGRRHINDIDKKQQFSNEIINYYIAKRQASRIQKIYDIDMETDKFTIEVSTPKKSDIKAHLQEIKPYKEFFSIIDYAVTIIDNNSTLKNNRLRIYNSKKQDYGYITPYYFNDYETLIKRINNNDTEKWLIFVQSESDGIRLFTTLSELCIETAFISAKTVKKKKKYNGQAAYQQIIEYQHFNYKVLIATSVIDCGVSIIDKNLI